MVLAPALRLTVLGLVAAEPLTVQLIGVVPVVVHVTEVVAAVVLLLLAGPVIVTTGAVPRLITIDLLSVPLAASEHATVTVFAPTARLTVAGLVAAFPFTVQVTGATPPDVVHETEAVVAVVLVPVAGDVIVTARPLTRLTVMTLVSE